MVGNRFSNWGGYPQSYPQQVRIAFGIVVTRRHIWIHRVITRCNIAKLLQNYMGTPIDFLCYTQKPMTCNVTLQNYMIFAKLYDVTSCNSPKLHHISSGISPHISYFIGASLEIDEFSTKSIKNVVQPPYFRYAQIRQLESP